MQQDDAKSAPLAQRLAQSPPRRILLIKPSALGDVVSAIPVLRALRRAYPHAHIAWMVAKECAGLLQDDSDISEIMIFDRRRLGKAWWHVGAFLDLLVLLARLRRGGFDLVLDLQGLLRSGIFAWVTRSHLRVGFNDSREWLARWFCNYRLDVDDVHIVERNMRFASMLGLAVGKEDWRLVVTDGARKSAADFLAHSGLAGQRYILAVPPTRWVTKIYPVRHWRAVLAELSKRWPIIVAGSPARQEVELCRQVTQGLGASTDGPVSATGTGHRVINAAGQTSLPQLAGLIAGAQGVICSDSAAQYIADALGVPAIALVGPTNPNRIRPHLHGRAVVADVPCQGCLKRDCGHIVCMESIQPSDIIAAANDLFI
jgi:heptosyltransferase-1